MPVPYDFLSWAAVGAPTSVVWFDKNSEDEQPSGSDAAPELVLRDPPMDPGAVKVDADTPDPGQHRRFGPLSGAKPM